MNSQKGITDRPTRMVNCTVGNERVGRVVAVTEEDEERLRPLRNLFQTELLLNPTDDGFVTAVCRHRPTTGKDENIVTC